MTSFFLSPAFFDQAVLGITPILLAALAGTLSERVGLFNIALEGQMLVGAFAAVAGSHFTGSLAGGVLMAVVASTLFSGLLAFGSAILRGNDIVIGISLNLLAAGLTSFLLRSLLGVSGTFSDSAMAGLTRLHIPGLADLPVIGRALGEQNPLVYLSWLLVAAIAIFLAYTPWGLRVRGIGEQADAAVTLGANAVRYRIAVTLAGGALCGLAGLQLSLGSLTLFSENMTAGRGWIAVAAVMLGRARPLPVAAACVLFGIADALGLKLQGEGLPNQITDSAPYVVTLIALVVAGLRQKIDGRKLSV
ncbi:MAG: Nucleoside transporter, permease protein 2 [Rhodospirillales bacterium]|jgi:general nucleoside transport system permease protein|nr:Nucleoside transporter, permease protein 2 [Rhodospirillales bacterium]